MNDIESTKGEIVMYQPDETIRLEVRMGDETVWLTQQQMAELFQKDQSVVARHINNVFKEGELTEESNMQFLHNTQYKYRPTKIYSLDEGRWQETFRLHQNAGNASNRAFKHNKMIYLS